MTLYKYGASAIEKPINDVLQRWRISLASLLFFTILLTDNFGLSTSGGGGLAASSSAASSSSSSSLSSSSSSSSSSFRPSDFRHYHHQQHPHHLNPHHQPPPPPLSSASASSSTSSSSSSISSSSSSSSSSGQRRASRSMTAPGASEGGGGATGARAAAAAAAAGNASSACTPGAPGSSSSQTCLHSPAHQNPRPAAASGVSDSLVADICEQGGIEPAAGEGGGKKRRDQLIRTKQLAFCSLYSVYKVIDSECLWKVRHGSVKECSDCIRSVTNQDEQARTSYNEFEELVSRFDCSRKYSNRADCTQCKNQYKNWLCTQYIQYYLINETSDVRRPLVACRDFCQEVEGQCPYFLPEVDNQYAGEPTFLCMDRTITSLSQQPVPCYKPCELNRTTTWDGHSCIVDNTSPSSAVSPGNKGSSSSASPVATNTVLSKQYTSLVAQLTFVWLIRISWEHLSMGYT